MKKQTKPPVFVGSKEFKTVKEAVAYTQGYDEGAKQQACVFEDMYESADDIKKSMKCPSDELNINLALVLLVVTFLGVISCIIFSTSGSDLLTDIYL